MKKILLLLVSLLIGSALFVWLGKVVGWKEIKQSFSLFNYWEGLVILGLSFLIALIGNWRWHEILKDQGVKISFIELLKSFLAGYALMFLAPIIFLSGEFFRAYILKEKNAVAWQKGMSSVIIDRILEWTANLFFIFLGGLIFYFVIGFPPFKIGIIIGLTFLVFVIGMLFIYFKYRKGETIVGFFIKSRKNQPLETEKEIFKYFKADNPAIWKGLGISFLRALVMYFRAWFLILFLGVKISAWPVISLLGFTYLAALIPIPTSLGSHEALQIFAFGSLGLKVSIATAFTLIIRAAELIVSSIGVIILLRLGIFLVRKALNASDNRN